MMNLPAVGTWTDEGGTLHAEALLRCQCHSTWWETRTQIQIRPSDYTKTPPNGVPLCHDFRTRVVCANCGRDAPS